MHGPPRDGQGIVSSFFESLSGGHSFFRNYMVLRMLHCLRNLSLFRRAAMKQTHLLHQSYRKLISKVQELVQKIYMENHLLHFLRKKSYVYWIRSFSLVQAWVYFHNLVLSIPNHVSFLSRNTEKAHTFFSYQKKASLLSWKSDEFEP